MQGQAQQAERYARQTLDILRATEDNHAIALALESLAYIYLEQDRPADALELLEEGQPLISMSGSPPDIAHYRISHARALAAIGQREEAATLAMELAGTLGAARPMERTRAYQLIGDLFRELGETARAQELYELAIESGESYSPGRHLVAAYQALAGLLKEVGRRDEAFDLLEKALAAQSGISSPAPARA
jgi:tetratricopeptide (TPR) repeat protein